MARTWAEHARAVIEATLRGLPPDADLKAKRRALRDAYPFGPREHWPYKAWCREVSIALGLRRRPRQTHLKRPAEGPTLFGDAE